MGLPDRLLRMRFATSQTLFFIEEWLTHPLRILEVGCGDGDLASALIERGDEVIAIDSDPDAVSAAKARGVDARVAVWPAFEGGKFGVVLFARSLHHIEPLDGAVAHARDVLRPEGRIMIEDFAPAEMSPRFLSWLRDELSRIGEEWQQDPVHPIADIRRVVASHFKILYEADTPYCYRYFPEEEASRIYDEELALGERLLGRRLVASLR